MASESKLLRHNGPFNSRVKRIMQADEDVGKVAKASPVLISTALEAFVKGLVDGAVEVALSRSARTLTASHLKAHIATDPLLDFCKPAVAEAPDLPSPGSEPPAAAAPKRSRSRKQPKEADGGDGEEPSPPKRSRGKGRGGGRGRGPAAAGELAGAELPENVGVVEDADALEQPAGFLPSGTTAVADDAQETPHEEACAVLPGSIPSFLMAGGVPAEGDEEDDYDA